MSGMQDDRQGQALSTWLGGDASDDRPLSESVNSGGGDGGGWDGAPAAGGLRPVDLGTLLRYKWTAILLAVLIAVPAVAAVWFFVVPEYTSRAEIRIRPIIPRLVFKTEDNGAIPFYDSYLNTQVSIIRSPTLIQRVLNEPEVRDTEWYKNPPKPLLGSQLNELERLRKELHVRPRGRTELIDVAMTTRNPQDAKVIVQAVVDHYRRYAEEKSNADENFIFRQLAEEANTLRNTIESRRKIAAKLRKDLGTGTPDELVSKRRVRLDEQHAELEQLERDIALTTWQLNELQKLFAGRQTADETSESSPTSQPSKRQRYERDPEWRKHYLQVRTQEHQLDMAAERLGQAHPKLLAMKKDLEFSRELQRLREEQLDRESAMNPMPTAGGGRANAEMAVAMDVEMLKRRIRMLKYKESLLQQAIADETKVFEQTFDSAQMLAAENEAIRHQEQIYKAVRARLEQKQMEGKVRGAMEVLSEPFAPSEPSKDRRLILTAMALFAAVSAGVAVAYFRAMSSQDIHRADDVTRTVHAPFLGQLPRIGASSGPALLDDVALNESVRMVRTSLLECMNGRSSSAVQITSATQGAGKTTLAVLLARSLAQCGKKVLLVDADLRNPALSELFGYGDGSGLVCVLNGRADGRQAIRTSSTPRLDVMPAGRACREDLELLANGKFVGCLKQWRGDYDVVLCDTSPVLPVADARIISRHMDGTVLVVREEYCQRRDVMDALAYIGTAGGRLAGSVFIGSRDRGGYYASRSYTYSSRPLPWGAAGSAQAMGQGGPAVASPAHYDPPASSGSVGRSESRDQT